MSSNRYTCLQDLNRIFDNIQFVSSFKLKNLLFKFSLKDRTCESCKIETWLNLPIKLELHHKDGNSHNNNFDNLEILCPNCHSYTETFCKRKSSLTSDSISDFEEIKNIIEDSFTISEVAQKMNIRGTGQSFYKISKIIKHNNLQLKPKPKSPKKTYKKYSTKKEALKAAAKQNEKIVWPNDDVLAEIVWEKSVAQLAREFGLSDNAIRHRCQYRNIPIPPVGYWRKLQVGKIEECNNIRESLTKEKTL